MTNEAAKRKAEEIAEIAVNRCDGWVTMNSIQRCECKRIIGEAIAQALAVPAGCVRDENLVDYKVLGTLPLTKDGCLIGDDCKVWYQGAYVNTELFRSSLPGESDWHPYRLDHAYSSPPKND